MWPSTAFSATLAARLRVDLCVCRGESRMVLVAIGRGRCCATPVLPSIPHTACHAEYYSSLVPAIDAIVAESGPLTLYHGQRSFSLAFQAKSGVPLGGSSAHRGRSLVVAIGRGCCLPCARPTNIAFTQLFFWCFLGLGCPRHPEVIDAVVVGFLRTGDGHNHRQDATFAQADS